MMSWAFKINNRWFELLLPGVTAVEACLFRKRTSGTYVPLVPIEKQGSVPIHDEMLNFIPSISQYNFNC